MNKVRFLHIFKSDAGRRWIRVAMFALTLWPFAEALGLFKGSLVALPLLSSKVCKVHVDPITGTLKKLFEWATPLSVFSVF